MADGVSLENFRRKWRCYFLKFFLIFCTLKVIWVIFPEELVARQSMDGYKNDMYMLNTNQVGTRLVAKPAAEIRDSPRSSSKPHGKDSESPRMIPVERNIVESVKKEAKILPDSPKSSTKSDGKDSEFPQMIPVERNTVEIVKKETKILSGNETAIMTDCPPESVLEIIGKEVNGSPPAQVCRIKDGNGEWVCQEGWLQLDTSPFCRKPKNGTHKATKPKWSQVDDNRGILFIHIPKTGGTSIETSFLFAEARKKVQGHYLGGHHKITAFEQEAFKSYHKFCMVRHPCSKLLSVWSYYAQKMGNAGDKKWVDKFFTNETLSSFNAFVMKTLKPEGPVNPLGQLHLQSQVGMIFDKENRFALDQLLVFEKWNDSIDALGNSLHEDLSQLKSTHRLGSRHKTCEDVYTEETWKKMTDIYALDFCTLGYSTRRNETKLTPPVDLTPAVLTTRYRDCRREVSVK